MVHMSIFQVFGSQTVSLCNKQINSCYLVPDKLLLQRAVIVCKRIGELNLTTGLGNLVNESFTSLLINS